MNEYFVNIKVDREERPDVDRMYMTFLQVCTLSPGSSMAETAGYIRGRWMADVDM